MDEANFYLKLQQAIDELPENYTILEEQVDVSVQMRYFNFSSRMKRKGISDFSESDAEALFDEGTPLKEKRRLLVNFASQEVVSAYRTIEKYLKNADPPLKAWATLALQESRMRLQSSLLDEQQVFISTGMGGKGKKLRYFVVFINADGNAVLNPTQVKVLKTEVNFALEKREGETEGFDFMEGFSGCTVILPLKADLRSVFREIIDECNQFGNFLQEDLVITNVKKLKRKDIVEMLNERDQDREPDFESN